MAPERRRLPALQAISAIPTSDSQRWLGYAASLLAAGVGWLQVRQPELPDRALLDVVHLLRGRFPRLQLSVSARADIARLGDVDGVHLPSRGLPVAAVRSIAGEADLVGRSTHSLVEIEAAVDEGADYVLFGPVFDPLSKAPQRPAVGLRGLAEACAQPIPVYALGGVTIDRFRDLADAGAAGVAGISTFLPPLLDRQLSRAAADCFLRS